MYVYACRMAFTWLVDILSRLESDLQSKFAHKSHIYNLNWYNYDLQIQFLRITIEIHVEYILHTFLLGDLYRLLTTQLAYNHC